MNALTAITTQSQRAAARVDVGSPTSRKHRGLLASLGFAAVLAVSVPASAQVLGSASNFAVLGATPNVTNVGPSVISGNVGVWPAASITGFPPGSIVPGTGVLHLGNTVAQQAQTDTTAAFITLSGLPSGALAPALGGLTITPGVYNTGVGANLTGTLTLNGPGLYVIQTPALTTAAGPGASAVAFINGASACDLWWVVNSSAAIGTFSQMSGNLLALTSITVGTSASMQGRLLARNGTVTMDSNNVTACSGGTAPGFLVPAAGPVLPPGVAAGGTGVPTLSEWAMILLASLLALSGFAAMRRKAN